MIVHWSREAIEDLVALRTWIGDRNPAAAKRVAAAIERSVDHLGEFPHLGHDGDLPATRELMVPGTPYFIVYRPGATAIEIVAVIHGARQWP